MTIDDVEDRFKDRNTEEKLSKRRSDILNIGTNKKFLIALDGERVVGLCRATTDEKENRVNAIYVLPEYQGKGVGTMLWNELKSFFDPSKDVLVGVATYNKKAITFYSKLGFADTGIRYADERHKMKSGVLLPQMDMILVANTTLRY